MPLVLIIEDDVAIGAVMRSLLMEDGFQVVVSRHALSVREVARLGPDVLVLDLMLGARAGGWDLLQTLSGAPGTARIPVVVCSADERRVQQIEDHREGLAAVVVRKPFAREDLLHAVRTALDGHPKS
jgi:CheY-like chemotaxis protein